MDLFSDGLEIDKFGKMCNNTTRIYFTNCFEFRSYDVMTMSVIANTKRFSLIINKKNIALIM